MADLPSELDDLIALRETLWAHLTEETPGKQKLGVGAIAGQLAKVIERIHVLDGTAAGQKEQTIADALAEARERRANGQARTSRRGTKSAR
jgi:hypothetical protein